MCAFSIQKLVCLYHIIQIVDIKSGRHFLSCADMGDRSGRSFGWKCAQRRPLRALAHALALFNPKYVFLGDDDTYVNFHLLQQFRLYGMDHGMDTEEVVYASRFCTRGCEFYLYGGSGYLFGQAVVELLIGDRLITRSNWTLHEEHAKSALLYHILLRAEASDKVRVHRLQNRSSSVNSCIVKDVANTKADDTVRVRSRLVDLCAELLSGEQTCLHSDHAVSQCLQFGAGVRSVTSPSQCLSFEKVLSNATTVPIASLGPYNLASTPPSPHRPSPHTSLTRNKTATARSLVSPLLLNHLLRQPQMCGYGFKHTPCDPRIHLTCHRHCPVSLTNSYPVRCPPRETAVGVQ